MDDDDQCEDVEKWVNAPSRTDAARLRRPDLSLLVETTAGAVEVDVSKSRGGMVVLFWTIAVFLVKRDWTNWPRLDGSDDAEDIVSPVHASSLHWALADEVEMDACGR